jgi:hypothetical protein
MENLRPFNSCFQRNPLKMISEITSRALDLQISSKAFVKSLTTLSIHMAFAAGLIVITLALDLVITILP